MRPIQLKALALALGLFLGGELSSYALAKGKPPRNGDSTTTSASTSTPTTTARHSRVTICHKAGKSGRWVKITVSAKAADKRLQKGDVLPDGAGKCPANTPKPTTTNGTTTTSG
jgi:hypothetical protein